MLNHFEIQIIIIIIIKKSFIQRKKEKITNLIQNSRLPFRPRSCLWKLLFFSENSSFKFFYKFSIHLSTKTSTNFRCECCKILVRKLFFTNSHIQKINQLEQYKLQEIVVNGWLSDLKFPRSGIDGLKCLQLETLTLSEFIFRSTRNATFNTLFLVVQI